MNTPYEERLKASAQRELGDLTGVVHDRVAGRLRVYYDVTVGPDPLVEVRAVGTKERNRVRVGGEIIEL